MDINGRRGQTVPSSVCARHSSARRRVIRGSNKIIYRHNEEHTLSHFRLVEKVLGLSADYNPLPRFNGQQTAGSSDAIVLLTCDAKHTSRGVLECFESVLNLRNVSRGIRAAFIVAPVHADTRKRAALAEFHVKNYL